MISNCVCTDWFIGLLVYWFIGLLGKLLSDSLYCSFTIGGLRITDYYNDLYKSIFRCQLPTANCQLPTANCQLPTANCQLPTANCQLTIHDSRIHEFLLHFP
jgi:hypothetical protein